jgi:hypothetical protein
MKINQIFKFKNNIHVPDKLRNKLVKIVENCPKPTPKDIPSFEHGFIHLEIDGEYSGFCGENWFLENVENINNYEK